MIAKAPGRFSFGRTGPQGSPNGFGQFWEPDRLPAYDFLDEAPTNDEINEMRSHRLSLYPAGYNWSEELVEGGICDDASGSYRMILYEHHLTFNGHDYAHIAAMRFPEESSFGPNIDYPVLIVCHGNIDEISLTELKSWNETLQASEFFSDQCVVLWPLYFGYTFRQPGVNDPDFPDYTRCADQLRAVGLRFFEESVDYMTLSLEDEQFKRDYQQDGYMAEDVQIMAVLQSYLALRDRYEGREGLQMSDEIGLIGSSLGGQLVYDLAPIVGAQTGPSDPELKASVAMYAGTDQYAPFNVRRSKRYLASLVKDMTAPNGFRMMYGDILPPQIRRTVSDAVLKYLGVLPGPAPSTEELRFWFLSDSTAKTWDYHLQYGGPWPLQVHHGTRDNVVLVDNSRRLNQEMRLHGVPREQQYFQYFESPNVGHNRNELLTTDHAAELLQEQLGW